MDIAAFAVAVDIVEVEGRLEQDVVDNFAEA